MKKLFHFFAVMCAIILLTSCKNAVSDEHVHTISYAINAEGHAISCSVCGYEEKVEAHTLSYAVDDSTHVLSCSVCGYEETAAAHDISYAVDASSHALSCSVCGYEEPATSHTLSYAVDASSHTLSCSVCGYEEPATSHTLSYAVDASSHALSCSVCGYEETATSHTLSYAVNDSTHAHSCSVCGYEEVGKAHNFSYAVNATKHYWACETCGYTKENGTHTFSYATTPTSHIWSCSICGYDEGSEILHSFDYAKNSTTHYWACTVCAYIAYHANHSFDSDKSCVHCGYITDSVTYDYYGIVKSTSTDYTGIHWDGETRYHRSTQQFPSDCIGSFVKVTVKDDVIVDYEILIKYDVVTANNKLDRDYFSDKITNQNIGTVQKLVIESNSYITIQFANGTSINSSYNDVYDMRTDKYKDVTDLNVNATIVYYEVDDYMYIIII